MKKKHMKINKQTMNVAEVFKKQWNKNIINSPRKKKVELCAAREERENWKIFVIFERLFIGLAL